MKISEVSKICKLTKKAISYYEQVGVLDKKYDTNGYRTYDEKDVILLKEVFVLRKLGMSVSDIKMIINSNDKHLALQNFRLKQEFQIEQEKAQHDYLLYYLNSNLSIEEAFNEIEHKLDHHMIIKDKLLQAFPGIYGKYLYIHFGKFLEGKIDSIEKIEAFNKIIEYLDRVESLTLHDDIQNNVMEQFDILSKMDLSKYDEGINELFNDYDDFKEKNKEFIEVYLAYRTSEEYKSSPAYRTQQIFLDFQKNNGYYDIFIPNLKILSDSYKKYYDKLNRVNEQFLADYPQAKNLGSE